MQYPDYRPRRLRKNENFRRMIRETKLSVDDLVYPLFAVPGKASSHTSAGANELIKDGAALVQSAEDVIEELSIKEIKPAKGEILNRADGKIARMTKAYICNSLTDNERKIYKVMSDEPVYIDDIVARAGMDMANASKVLLSLQLKRLILEVPGKQYIRKEAQC